MPDHFTLIYVSGTTPSSSKKFSLPFADLTAQLILNESFTRAKISSGETPKHGKVWKVEL